MLLLPPSWMIHVAVAAVWLYEGLWCKLLNGEPRQMQVVEAVPRFGPRVGAVFLKLLGSCRGWPCHLGLERFLAACLRACANGVAHCAERRRTALGPSHHSRPGRDGGQKFRFPRARLGLCQFSRMEVNSTIAATNWERGRFGARYRPDKLLFGRMYEDAAIELDAFRPGWTHLLHCLGRLHRHETCVASRSCGR